MPPTPAKILQNILGDDSAFRQQERKAVLFCARGCRLCTLVRLGGEGKRPAGRTDGPSSPCFVQAAVWINKTTATIIWQDSGDHAHTSFCGEAGSRACERRAQTGQAGAHQLRVQRLAVHMSCLGQGARSTLRLVQEQPHDIFLDKRNQPTNWEQRSTRRRHVKMTTRSAQETDSSSMS